MNQCAAAKVDKNVTEETVKVSRRFSLSAKLRDPKGDMSMEGSFRALYFIISSTVSSVAVTSVDNVNEGARVWDRKEEDSLRVAKNSCVC